MLWPFLLAFLFAAGIVWLSWGYLREREMVNRGRHVIPTSVHGGLDYLVGAGLIALPWLLGFAYGGAETWVPVVVGGSVLLYSALTDYEWGLLRLIPVPIHLLLDSAGGLFLFMSPFLWGFASEVMNPHLGVGLLEIVVALITRPYPDSSEAGSKKRPSETPGRRAEEEPAPGGEAASNREA